MTLSAAFKMPPHWFSRAKAGQVPFQLKSTKRLPHAIHPVPASGMMSKLGFLTDAVNSTLVLKFNLGWNGIHLASCPRHFIRLARYSWNGTRLPGIGMRNAGLRDS